MQFRRVFVVLLALFASLLTSDSAQSSVWNPYVIRESGGNAPGINPIPGGYEFLITEGGMKAALGTSAIDGRKVSEILNISISREDDITRFNPGSGPAVAPYLNLWITDGNGNFAVLANEPSNGEWNHAAGEQWNLSWDNLQDKVAKVYENTVPNWLPSGNLTFADFADFIIMAPSAADIDTGWSGLGLGAPREYGTNEAYGVNWVFGDTLSHYISGDDPGYQVINAQVAAIPEPASLVVWGLLASCGLGAAWLRRRRSGLA